MEQILGQTNNIVVSGHFFLHQIPGQTNKITVSHNDLYYLHFGKFALINCIKWLCFLV